MEDILDLMPVFFEKLYLLQFLTCLDHPRGFGHRKPLAPRYLIVDFPPAPGNLTIQGASAYKVID